MALTIGEVAKRSGIGLETVRFYERKGSIMNTKRRIEIFSAGCPASEEII